MAESEGIKEVVNQVAVWAAVAAILALRNTDRPWPTTVVSHRELPHEQNGPLLVKLAFY